MNQLPPAHIIYKLKDAPLLPCNHVDGCNREVRGFFPPVFCHSHRNNLTPIVGFAYITAFELSVVNAIRANNVNAAHLNFAITQAQIANPTITIDELAAATSSMMIENGPPPSVIEEIADDDGASDSSL